MSSKKHLICIEKYRLIYAPIPKAANSSMKWLLAGLLPRDETVRHRPPKQRYWAQATYGTSTLVDPACVAGMDTQDWFSFTVIRHPLDRLVSCYNNKVLENPKVNERLSAMGVHSKMEFGDFVERICPVGDTRTEIHLRSQHYTLTHRNQVVVKFVARFENLAEDYPVIRDNLAQASGQTVPELPRRNVRRSHDDDFLAYYKDQGLLRLAVRRYRKDFETFYPNELRAIGLSKPTYLLMPAKLAVLQRRLRRSLTRPGQTR